MEKTIHFLLAIVFLTSCNHFRSKELPTSSSIQLSTEPVINPNKQELKSINEQEGMFVQTKNGAGVWTPEERKTFMTACVDGTTENMGEDRSTNYCACLLRKLENLYPVADEVINLPEKKQIELSNECLR